MTQKIFLPIAFPNQLHYFKLSSEEIESQIKTFSLAFLQIRDQEVEWSIKFPIFLRSFYGFIYKKYKIPSQADFWIFYQKLNKDWFVNNPLEEVKIQALKARVFRAYPSLIRDLHFAKLCEAQLADAEVLYNTKLDVNEGIDLLLTKANNHHGFNLFTETRRAHVGRSKKTNRHTLFTNVMYHDIPVDFGACKSVGDFFLYGLKEVNEIKAIMDQNLS